MERVQGLGVLSYKTVCFLKDTQPLCHHVTATSLLHIVELASLFLQRKNSFSVSADHREGHTFVISPPVFMVDIILMCTSIQKCVAHNWHYGICLVNLLMSISFLFTWCPRSLWDTLGLEILREVRERDSPLLTNVTTFVLTFTSVLESQGVFLVSLT